MPPDDTTRRLSMRIDASLKHQVDQEAQARGQSLRVFVERALNAALPTKTPRSISLEPARSTARAPLAADPRGSDRASRSIPTHPRVTRSPALDRFAGGDTRKGRT